MAAFSFSWRDKWSYGAAAGVALTLGLGGWAYNSMNGGKANAAPLRPHTTATAVNAPMDLPAGGAADVSPPASVVGETLMVHVTGSVKVPGVYKLKPGDRINDAVKAAGGFKVNAQQDALNLADTVRDADQIFVPSRVSSAAPASKTQTSGNGTALVDTTEAAPRHPLIVRGTPVRVALASAAAASQRTQTETAEPVMVAEVAAAPSDDPPPSAPAEPGRVLGKPAPTEAEETGDDPKEAAPAPAPTTPPTKSRSTTSTRKTGSVAAKSAGASKTSAKFKNPGDGIVHLNSANAAQLEQLPGIGPAMSARVLEYRHQIGGFKSIEQMLDVKGIGDKKFAKMRPFLAL